MQRFGSRQLGPSRLTKGSCSKVSQELFDVLASAVDQLSQPLLEHLWVEVTCHPGRVGCVEKLDGQTVVVEAGRPRPHLLVRADDRSPAGIRHVPVVDAAGRPQPLRTHRHDPYGVPWRQIANATPHYFTRALHAHGHDGSMHARQLEPPVAVVMARLPLRLGRSISEVLRAACASLGNRVRGSARLREHRRVTGSSSLAARSVQELRSACAAGEQPRYVFFWGHRPRRPGVVDQSCLSQWWPCRFEADGQRFESAEQYMMWRKACLFGDRAGAEAILKARSAAHAKALGREVRDFDEATWIAHRWVVVVAGSLAKFAGDDALRAFLVSTRQRVLVEASPVDAIWGVGIAADDKAASDPSQWPGLNLLGFALMEARSAL
ncbi:NADAR family protein [Intrasporangium calvum]